MSTRKYKSRQLSIDVADCFIETAERQILLVRLAIEGALSKEPSAPQACAALRLVDRAINDVHADLAMARADLDRAREAA